MNSVFSKKKSKISKTHPLVLVKRIVDELEEDVFRNYDIQKKSGMSLHYKQVKDQLKALEELGEVKFIKSIKSYMRIPKNER